MTLDYDKRIDFRAFDVLADAIEHATPDELLHAIASCDDIARNWDAGTNSHAAIKRLLFRCFANMLRLYLRRFNKSQKLWQQTVSEITRGL